MKRTAKNYRNNFRNLYARQICEKRISDQWSDFENQFNPQWFKDRSSLKTQITNAKCRNSRQISTFGITFEPQNYAEIVNGRP